MLFGEIVIRKGLASVEQVEECLQIQERLQVSGDPKPLGRIMVERGHLTNEQVAEVLGELPIEEAVKEAGAASRARSGKRLSGRAPAVVDPHATRAEAPVHFIEPEKTRTELPAHVIDPQKTRTELPPAERATIDALPPYQRPAAPLSKAPPEIPGYVIDSKLGEGAMGAVYRGRSVPEGREVAIKLLPPRLARDAEYIARFQREARSAIKLDHPCIVRGLTYGEKSGYHYFVMEYVEGESLEKRLKRDGRIPEKEAIEIGIAVASALQVAARLGIVHRDMKPANILRSKDGLVKLVDLGLAKQVNNADQQVTRVGVILGSPHYLAPEQAARGALDVRTDLYGLGATLYHLVTGESPFDAKDPLDILDQVLHAPPPDARVRNPAVSPELAAVLKRLLAKKREDRYPTAKSLREELEHLRDTGRLLGTGRGWLFDWLRRLLGRRAAS